MTRQAKINCFAISHAGRHRDDNQDAVKVQEPDASRTAQLDPDRVAHLYGIADGMGGYAHGGLASTLALETFFDIVSPVTVAQVPTAMKRGMQNANLAIYQKAHQLGVGRMGTTLTAVGVAGEELHVAHVGDSRAYHIRGKAATCLTSDHTMVGELVRMKVLSPDKIRTHSQRSRLNRSLGVEMFVTPEIFSIPLLPDDRIVLCTDGIWAVIEDAEFGQLVSASTDLEALGKQLLDLAMDRDTDDNVSVVIIHAERLAKGATRIPARHHRFPNLFQRFARKTES